MKQWVINLMLFSAAIVAIGFSLLRVVPFEVTESTYIGIIVTFIGIIVTVLVGFIMQLNLKKILKNKE